MHRAMCARLRASTCSIVRSRTPTSSIWRRPMTSFFFRPSCRLQADPTFEASVSTPGPPAGACSPGPTSPRTLIRASRSPTSATTASSSESPSTSHSSPARASITSYRRSSPPSRRASYSTPMATGPATAIGFSTTQLASASPSPLRCGRTIGAGATTTPLAPPTALRTTTTPPTTGCQPHPRSASRRGVGRMHTTG